MHSRQKTINSYTCILRDVIARGVINSVCSPLVVIHTLKLCRTSLYFSPSSFIKKTIELFHNLPTLDVLTDDDRETYFSRQPLKLSTWFLHYWNEENLLHPVSLHIIFANLFFTKIWCSELFYILQYVIWDIWHPVNLFYYCLFLSI